MSISNSSKGTIVFQNLTDEICDPLNGPLDLLKLVTKYLGVEIPAGITNVIIGNQTPGQDQTDYLWIRRDVSGVIEGPYVFCNGKWRPLTAFAPNQLIRVYNSDSRNIPEDYALFSTAYASQQQVDFQMATWLMDTSNTYYVIFDIVYIGCAG